MALEVGPAVAHHCLPNVGAVETASETSPVQELYVDVRGDGHARVGDLGATTPSAYRRSAVQYSANLPRTHKPFDRRHLKPGVLRIGLTLALF